MQSPFLTPGLESQPNSLALLHLRRDHAIATLLRTSDDENLGYAEGKVTNTRYGSFPHSTLMHQPWGSQIVASKVDTGSRGRKKGQKKRKADELEDSTNTTPPPAAATAAASGFLHLFSPTPESWTLSLPHRTQVVYMPDYSYILERLRARPGSTIIEAGSGSGSFTHASARAVFNGYPACQQTHKQKRRRLGKVYSYEFHEQRATKLHEEIHQHGLDGVVQVTHRDVYEDGFLLEEQDDHRNNDDHDESRSLSYSPKANVVFLDLPAPWLALRHLVRRPASGVESPLDPSSPIQLCTFSPCLEQVQRTISAMRRLGWLSISMEELQHRRIDVRREICGLDVEGVRGALAFPKSVEEAVVRSRSVEERAKWFRDHVQQQTGEEEQEEQDTTRGDGSRPPSPKPKPNTTTPFYEMGHLVHRSELDLKTHTSYLVFAVLPRDWTEEDELKCREMWPINTPTEQASKRKSKKQLKQEEAKVEKQKGAEKEAVEDDEA